MIRVCRPAAPPILAKKASMWLNSLRSAPNKSERNRVQAKYRHAQIKEALVKMFHGKCAYCESYIIHIDYGHIEHFRPKSMFPVLTFEWSNFFLACPICNNNKVNKFPDAADGGPLVNPCDDDPANHFKFIFINGIASVYGCTPRGEVTERLLELNRQDLRHFRSQRIRQIAAIKCFANTDQEAAALLSAAAEDQSEFAAFVRNL